MIIPIKPYWWRYDHPQNANPSNSSCQSWWQKPEMTIHKRRQPFKNHENIHIHRGFLWKKRSPQWPFGDPSIERRQESTKGALNQRFRLHLFGTWARKKSGARRSYGYGSVPINTIFSGMNIHLPAILMFTGGTRFWHTAIYGFPLVPTFFSRRSHWWNLNFGLMPRWKWWSEVIKHSNGKSPTNGHGPIGANGEIIYKQRLKTLLCLITGWYQ